MSTALAKAESALAMEMDPFADQTKDLTDDHLKLLYMVSKYASAAEHRGDSETWIRQTHLNVLIYEGVKAGVFDYDYAPASTLVGVPALVRPELRVEIEAEAILDQSTD